MIRAFIALLLPGVLSSAAPAQAASISNQTEVVGLELNDYLRRVLDYNESVQAQMLEAEAGNQKARAELGKFEPELVNSLTREANQRTNNVIQQASQSGSAYFTERNTIYDAGLETLVPTGAKIRLGYTLSDLVNNVNPYGSIFSSTNSTLIQQYQTFVGVTLTQPLLKNGGTGVTLASVRMADLDSDIAFEQYRRQLMITISRAESAYWNLYFAQQQLRFFDESVSVAQSILSDSQEKMKAGRAAELEVLEAQSGLALRKTKQNEAIQNYYSALDQLYVLAGEPPAPHGRSVRAVDVPGSTNAPLSYYQSFQTAFDLNPDYLIQLKKVDQEKTRLGVARNQVLPELNLKAAYGYNGLGTSPGNSWDVAQSQDFPSWSVGLELRLPMAGNIKGRHQLKAMRLTLQEAVMNLHGIQTQIENMLNTSIQQARSWRDSIQSYQTVVDFNESLLKTQLARLNVGKIEPRKVLEVEADLFDARQSLAQALVQYQRSLLQLQLADGTILKSRHLDLTKEELKDRTLALLKSRSLPMDSYRPVEGFSPQSE